jgi:hypothetical protein
LFCFCLLAPTSLFWPPLKGYSHEHLLYFHWYLTLNIFCRKFDMKNDDQSKKGSQ